MHGGAGFIPEAGTGDLRRFGLLKVDLSIDFLYDLGLKIFI